MSEDASTGSVLPADLRPAVGLLVNAIVGKHGVPAPLQAVEATIEAMRPAIASLYTAASDPAVYKGIAGAAMQQVAVAIDPPIILAPKFVPWFNNVVVSGGVKLERWYSYKQYLTHSEGFAPQVLDSLDKASSEVVDLLGDPTQSGEWKRRGLVIGDVQSGKTATYIGIVNKAADAGYKLVVLLTGGTESLRKQTQFRVDQGFLGNDSSVVGQDKIIGVGDYPTNSKFLRGQGMTTRAKDFVGSSLQGQAVSIDPNADHPYVFVIKKNKTPLANLIQWLTGQFNGAKFDIPMLVVDDESDYASVNTNYKTSGDTNPTIINQKIRELLALTTRSSYMAFTATPFANVFIDHNSFSEALEDDLFPHHYIFALSSPSNYIGAKKFFGTAEKSKSGGLVDITDAHEIFPPKHKSHLEVLALPDSLDDAIRAFVVASAIRLWRGDERPRSMLVNVSRFKNVQSQVFDLVAHEFGRIKAAIEIHAQPAAGGQDEHPILKKLAQCYDSYYADCGASWIEVRSHLFEAVFDVTVDLVNSSRDKSADDVARNAISVGGDVLSRGLTLNGLTVSYFYRLVGAADTLLQMARWFGYRPGYEDLARVWISPEIADQFRFVSDVSEELREQIREMRELDKTPKDFGLMVRKHPETLAITAKRGVSESHSMIISLSGQRIETVKLPAKSDVLARNRRAVREFMAAIQTDDPAGEWDHNDGGLKYFGKLGVSKKRIADLLEAFRYDRGNLIFANSLHKIVRNQTTSMFQDWTVGVVSGDGPPLELAPGVRVTSTPKRAVRYSADGSTGTFRISGSSARLAGSTDLAKTFQHRGPDLKEPEVYREMDRPTLLIYALAPDFKVVPKHGSGQTEAAAQAEQTAAEDAWAEVTAAGVDCLVALKVAIPGAQGDKGGDVTYLLNGPAIEAFAQDFEVNAEDEDDVDD